MEGTATASNDGTRQAEIYTLHLGRVACYIWCHPSAFVPGMMLSSRRRFLEPPPSLSALELDQAHCSGSGFSAIEHRPAFHVPRVDGPLLGASHHEEINP